MKIDKNDIIEELYKNDTNRINLKIKKMIPFDFRDDFKHHLFMQLFNMNTKKLMALHKKKQLEFVVLRIIDNQWYSTTSPFWKLFRNKGSYRERYIDDFEFSDFSDSMADEEYKENDYLEQIDDILNRMNIIDAFCFRKYYYEHMTYKQIMELTGVSDQSIRLRVQKAIIFIKKQIKY